MSSKRRIDASRRNGALSRGPKTEAGKSRSSQNATRHGLLSKRVVLDGENAQNFDTVHQQHLDKFKPRDGVECGFIEEMSACYWRYHRALAIEKSLFDKALDLHPDAATEPGRHADAWSDLAGGTSLQSILRYQTSMHRMYRRALNNFLLVRGLDLENTKLRNEPIPDIEHLENTRPLSGEAPADAPDEPELQESAAAEPQPTTRPASIPMPGRPQHSERTPSADPIRPGPFDRYTPRE
jgi:hypothetical protein